MSDKILPKKHTKAFLEKLKASGRLVAPVEREEGFYFFEEIEDVDDVACDYNLAYYSPKKFLIPPAEMLLTFEESAGQTTVTPTIEAEETVLFGVHPCDMNAIWMLDAAFSEDPRDEYYAARRDKTTLIALNCLEPCDEHSFCHDMKTDEIMGPYDLNLTDLGDAHYVDVGSDRGASLVADMKDATEEDRKKLKEAFARKAQAFQKRLAFDSEDLPELLEASYDSLVWEATARKCYSCGSCTMVCPTCYCFDVRDQVNLSLISGTRERRWDSCQLEGFAEVAGGENFRGERASRVRHRLFRKGKYLKEKFNRPGCVGCGRCDRTCTAGISVVTICNQLKGGA